MCEGVCACVYVKERERERDNDGTLSVHVMPYKLCECVGRIIVYIKIEASLPVVIKFGTKKKCLSYPIKEQYAHKFPAFSKV